MEWKAEWWLSQPARRTDISESLRHSLDASACKQASILRRQVRGFAAKWVPVLLKHNLGSDWVGPYIKYGKPRKRKLAQDRLRLSLAQGADAGAVAAAVEPGPATATIAEAGPADFGPAAVAADVNNVPNSARDAAVTDDADSRLVSSSPALVSQHDFDSFEDDIDDDNVADPEQLLQDAWEGYLDD
ncbi:hypothetical protein PUNSTDRAFT_130493 [Punctularia strigosozonata HHB-11173 SS5]|nr:uncharacterized protein PUNSTDRAFT_130493 [Punctularia strigosozonata HHB-11173 SS5]EIN12223.1 hypothetical protein PUNSTDRAFT_130493 [Punctularia strigosozonata HHB-11173 SS5]